MPSFPKHPCGYPGCAALVPQGRAYCPKHTEVRSATSRGYDAAWRKARRAFLNDHPLCEACKKNGVFTKATVVDHIKPHRGDRTLFWDRDNWQALCKACHDKKTGDEDSRPLYHY